MEIGNQQALFHEVRSIAEELIFTSLDKKKINNSMEKDYGAA